MNRLCGIIAGVCGLLVLVHVGAVVTLTGVGLIAAGLGLTL